MVFPHVVGGSLSSSDSASWKSLNSKRDWESPFLEDVEWSANSWASWDTWLGWDTASVFNPSLALESPPDAFDVLEDVATMMPVALIPGPSNSGEAVLGWSPVVPPTIIPSVPDLLI
jgi:hypothetical protein